MLTILFDSFHIFCQILVKKMFPLNNLENHFVNFWCWSLVAREPCLPKLYKETTHSSEFNKRKRPKKYWLFKNNFKTFWQLTTFLSVWRENGNNIKRHSCPSFVFLFLNFIETNVQKKVLHKTLTYSKFKHVFQTVGGRF